MDLVVSVLSIDTGGADDLRSLAAWLEAEPELRGRVTFLESDPSEGRLGPLVEALQIALGSSGLVAAISGVIVAWIGSRPGDVTVKLIRGDDKIEVSAGRVRSLDTTKLAALTVEIVEALESTDDRG
ncbi:hypothetical protein [Streptosporangium sp. NPDC049046]|uniref:effector-associated constant component EACC1 n=1 Tax=unclassified Streptosporangium TaxID=2632669 RepID=UPI00343251C2